MYLLVTHSTVEGSPKAQSKQTPQSKSMWVLGSC